jgi:hypothetical protein
MKTRRHHNNKGLRQIKRGKTRLQVQRIKERLLFDAAKLITHPTSKVVEYETSQAACKWEEV